jgi:SAM-dependent methyltransferase
MTDGWNHSARAWIASQGSEGDWSRRHVLDAPMLARVSGRGFGRALDLGCGEGRFCRQLQCHGIATVGVDPTAALIEHARRCDPAGDYRLGRAEALDLPDASVDLVVSYLSLIDIADLPAAIGEVRRVLRPGGSFLVANLQSYNTASIADGWTREPDGSRRFCIDDYMDEKPRWSEWHGIRVQNWHRPLGSYMQALLSAQFELRHFEEPLAVGGDPQRAERYRRVPHFLVMEWERGQGSLTEFAG